MYGMGSLILVAVIVAVILVWRRGAKRDKALKELYGCAGYEVALKIKDELVKNGYTAGELSVNFFDNTIAEGSLSVSGGTGSSSGTIIFCHSSLFSMTRAGHLLRMKNIKNTTPEYYYYAIENKNICLHMRSDEKTQGVPQFLEIAAEVIKNSGYKFEHPDYFNEQPEVKKYLNVMFQ